MKPFESYLLIERWKTEGRTLANTARRVQRRLTREELRARTWENRVALGVVLLAFLIFYTPVFFAWQAEREEIPPQPAAATAPADVAEQEDYENEKIEEALYASGYFREDVPLDGDTQALLHAACDESGIPYELALAVIEQETGFRNVTGDDGASCGYMQIQEKWHRDRMARLGVTDLMDPFGNFRVGCDFLAELLDQYSLEEALTAYNSGRPGKSQYADSVIARMGSFAGEVA